MNGKEHILVVEDDHSLAEWVSDYLISHGYMLSIANNGEVAVELIHNDEPDLVILDVMLPKKNGLQVCQEARQFYSRPILMLTACDEEADEVLGLDMGADDYLTKPVKPRVLLARVQALLRRTLDIPPSGMYQEKTFRFGQLNIDSHSKSAALKGEDLGLTNHEFDVLWLLAMHAGRTISRTDLVNQLRGIDYDGFDRSVDIRISRLRKKLQDDPSKPYKIKTVWGKGYMLALNAWD